MDELAKTFSERELAKKFALSQEGRQIISDQDTINVREGARLWKW